MPNHIKNRIELVGSPEDVKSLVEKFSTFYPTTPRVAYDGRLVYKGSEKHQFGWFDEATGIFSQREKPDSVGIPEGFTPDFDEEWTRFPDFEKVFPMPDVIKAVGDSVCSSVVDAVKAKYYANVSKNALLAGLELANRRNAKVKPEDQAQFELACKAYEETGFSYWYDWNCENWGTKWNSYSCEQQSDNVFIFETAWSSVLGIIKEISKHFNGTIHYKFADEDTGSNTGDYKIAHGVVLSEYRPVNGSKEAYDLAFELRPHYKEDYILVNGNYESKED